MSIESTSSSSRRKRRNRRITTIDSTRSRSKSRSKSRRSKSKSKSKSIKNKLTRKTRKTLYKYAKSIKNRNSVCKKSISSMKKHQLINFINDYDK
jgi:predicted flavoprotein YhiN